MIPDWLTGAFEFLVGMNMHPMVTLVVFIVLLVFRVRFEEPYIIAAKEAVAAAAAEDPSKKDEFRVIQKANEQKAEQVSRWASFVALALSLAGQFALYWPRSGQARALCVFFSFAQIGLAMMAMYYVERYGLIDRLGRYFQKKADEKAGV